MVFCCAKVEDKMGFWKCYAAGFFVTSKRSQWYYALLRGNQIDKMVSNVEIIFDNMVVI